MKNRNSEVNQDEFVETDVNLIEMTTDIVSAYVSHNTLVAEKLPEFIASVHTALRAAKAGAMDQPKEELKPAVPIKKSVTDDYIICLFDGKRFRSLKRHIRTKFNMSPDEYRKYWDLPDTYPMVSPSYAAQRSALAKSTGLGQRRKDGVQSFSTAA